MTILDEIAAYTRERVTSEKLAMPEDEMRRRALAAPAPEGFPFERALAQPGLSFICEIKKASPSKGVIAEKFPYLEIARAYERAGASALSVLTEPRWFLGSATYLAEIASAVHIPILRKDFVVDAYQIYEARALGASAVLLIIAILTDAQLAEYARLADSLGLSALVEAHDREEIERARAIGARIIGVNNRNLKTFGVDMTNSARLRDFIPDGALYVSESGIAGPDDIRALADARPDATLIGEAMMRADDKTRFLRSLAGAATWAT